MDDLPTPAEKPNLTPEEQAELAALSADERAAVLQWLAERTRAEAELRVVLAEARGTLAEGNRQLQEWSDSAPSAAWREALAVPLASGLLVDEALRAVAEGRDSDDIWTVANILGAGADG